MQAPDPILVLRAQTGDRDALDALLRMCQSPLHRYITGLLGDATAAEDVLQECLFRIARKLKWLSDPSLFRAWAFLFAADFSNKTHMLLLIGLTMSYTIVILGLVALGAHVNRSTLRILQAIDAARGSQAA